MELACWLACYFLARLLKERQKGRFINNSPGKIPTRFGGIPILIARRKSSFFHFLCVCVRVASSVSEEYHLSFFFSRVQVLISTVVDAFVDAARGGLGFLVDDDGKREM